MKTSRLLNERSGFLGLSVLDLGVIGYILIISHSLLGLIEMELLSFLVSGLAAVFLIHIRLTQRERIIRDFLKYYVTPKKLG
jgi:hypothetical protein